MSRATARDSAPEFVKEMAIDLIDEEVIPPDPARGGGGGMRSITVGTRTGQIAVWIDFEKIVRRFGRRALSRASKQATACSGAVVVRALHVLDARLPKVSP